jgi:hypothetical protein
MASRGSKVAPLTGVAAVVLIVIGFIIGGDPPDIEDSGEQVLDFYLDEEGSQIASSIVVVYGAMLFVFFVATLRGRLRREEDTGAVLSTAAFGGGLLMALGIALFAGINFTLADTAENIDASAAQALNALNYDLFFPLALGTEVFFLATGIAVVRGGGLPSWLGWIAIVLAIIALTPIGFIAFLAGGVWILVASILLTLQPAGGGLGPPPPAAPATPPEIR